MKASQQLNFNEEKIKPKKIQPMSQYLAMAGQLSENKATRLVLLKAKDFQ